MNNKQDFYFCPLRNCFYPNNSATIANNVSDLYKRGSDILHDLGLIKREGDNSFWMEHNILNSNSIDIKCEEVDQSELLKTKDIIQKAKERQRNQRNEIKHEYFPSRSTGNAFVFTIYDKLHYKSVLQIIWPYRTKS